MLPFLGHSVEVEYLKIIYFTLLNRPYNTTDDFNSTLS